MNNSDPTFGPGESHDGNPFGKPGQDFRDSQRKADAAAEKESAERAARLQAANLPPAPAPIEEPPALDEKETAQCTACSIQ